MTDRTNNDVQTSNNDLVFTQYHWWMSAASVKLQPFRNFVKLSKFWKFFLLLIWTLFGNCLIFSLGINLATCISSVPTLHFG